ncbi:MAG: T9SS type A sorting domain-containing protein [Bacteroidales bacterium]|nr:T9SS type A sorting domain-containing protein [Bacteroidales bacterium]
MISDDYKASYYRNYPILVPCEAKDKYKSSSYWQDATNIVSIDMYEREEYKVICQGESYKGHTTSGTYYDTIRTSYSCDSLITINLYVNPTYDTTITAIICNNATYTENNFNEVKVGIYTQELKTINGCDSIVTLDLKVNPVVYTAMDTLINNGSAIEFCGRNISKTGIYTDTLLSYLGCDSIITLKAEVVQIQTNVTDVKKASATLNAKIMSAIISDNITKTGFIVNTDTVFAQNTNSEFATALNDLECNKEYSYQAFCIANNQWFESEIKTFITLAFDTEDDIYNISTAEELLLLADLINSGNEQYNKAEYQLMNDIYLDSTLTNNIIAIGKYSDNIFFAHPFSGTFDGNNHLIYNINIEQLADSCQGLFGYTKDAEIKNLGLKNINVISKKYTGGMVGYADNTKISSSYVNGGYLYAASYSGGFVGYQTSGDNSIITSCYNTCQVQGNNYIGGLLGYSNRGVVRNSYVAAPVIGLGETAIGAIIGGANDVLTYNFYFSTTTTGQTKAIGLVVSKKSSLKAGEGKTDNEMKSGDFVELLNNSLSVPVFKTDFTIKINDGFPVLQWQDGINIAVTTNEAANITDNSAILNATFEVNVDTALLLGFQYKKIDENLFENVFIDGKDNYSYKIINLTQNTKYVYRAIAVLGSDTIAGNERIFTTLRGASLDEIDTDEVLSVYPNPTKKGLVTIKSNGAIIILNSFGQILKEIKNENGIAIVDVKDWKSGVYYIKSGNVTKKLIVE